MIGTALAVDGDLKTIKVRLVTDVCDLFCLSALNEVCNIVDNCFNACRIRDLGNLDEILCLIDLVLCSYGKS